MISWATSVSELYPFLDYVGVEDNVNALHEHLRYTEGLTMTGAMIESYMEFLNEDQRALAEAGREQVIVLITDGVPTDLVCSRSDEFAQSVEGMTVVIVAIGQDQNTIMSRMECLQPDVDKYVLLSSFEVCFFMKQSNPNNNVLMRTLITL